jgi:hypothetical protein
MGVSPRQPSLSHPLAEAIEGHCHVRGFYLSTARRARRPHGGKSTILGSRYRGKSPRKSPILGQRDNALPDPARLPKQVIASSYAEFLGGLGVAFPVGAHRRQRGFAPAKR